MACSGNHTGQRCAFINGPVACAGLYVVLGETVRRGGRIGIVMSTVSPFTYDTAASGSVLPHRVTLWLPYLTRSPDGACLHRPMWGAKLKLEMRIYSKSSGIALEK